PIPASSGQTIRYRLDRGGDRQLNRALHTVIMIRRNSHAPTLAYLERRTREGKTSREASAASSATWPATSTGYSKEPLSRLDINRSITISDYDPPGPPRLE